jgi:uncharacterized membrane protein
MNLMEGILSPIWLYSADAIFIVLMAWALWRAPWFKVVKDGGAQGVFFGCVVILMLLWSLTAGVVEGLKFHLLAMTLVTLMFGPQFAFMAGALALLGVTLNGKSGWETFALNWVLMVLIPVLITHGLYLLSRRWLARHFFVYVLVNGFLAAAASMVVVVLLIALILMLNDVYAWMKIANEFLVFLPMMLAPEAFLNGFVLTILVVNKPQWLASFSDEDYLKGK